MTEICQRASSYDLLDEELHYWVAVGLAGQRKYQQALDYCEDARTLLKKRLGISSLDIIGEGLRGDSADKPDGREKEYERCIPGGQ